MLQLRSCALVKPLADSGGGGGREGKAPETQTASLLCGVFALAMKPVECYKIKAKQNNTSRMGYQSTSEKEWPRVVLEQMVAFLP